MDIRRTSRNHVGTAGAGPPAVQGPLLPGDPGWPDEADRRLKECGFAEGRSRRARLTLPQVTRLSPQVGRFEGLLTAIADAWSAPTFLWWRANDRPHPGGRHVHAAGPWPAEYLGLPRRMDSGGEARGHSQRYQSVFCCMAWRTVARGPTSARSPQNARWQGPAGAVRGANWLLSRCGGGNHAEEQAERALRISTRRVDVSGTQDGTGEPEALPIYRPCVCCRQDPVGPGYLELCLSLTRPGQGLTHDQAVPDPRTSGTGPAKGDANAGSYATWVDRRPGHR